MTRPVRPSRRRIATATLAAASIAAVPAFLTVLPAGAEDTPASPPVFKRINVDTSISGASFTSVGEVFAGEQDIVTSGYGALDENGRPVGGGTLQLYRPGATLSSWTKVTVFDATEGIVFPNATSIEDVDGDGDNDIIVPSGYFFATDPAYAATNTGAITWWENHGPGTPFEKHVVVESQAGSYHGVQLADLDDDGIDDLVTVSEEAKQAPDQVDDVIGTQFFKGLGDGAFHATPVVLVDGLGGSQPVVYDIDGDDDLDIVSSQYFDVMDNINNPRPRVSFHWFENTHAEGALSAADFTQHTIATVLDTETGGRGVGMGFQIRPVPGFRGPGTVSWIGTNHVNRCTIPAPFSAIPEEVIEFIPKADLTQQWTLNSLSDRTTPPPACPTDYRDGDYQEHSDQITARWGYGQGAPGVFGYGDIDGDADVDLLVSGDGDRRLWWIENEGDGNTTLHRLTGQGEYFGQAGGAVVADLNGTGGNELVFSSFDYSTLAIWTRDTDTSTSTPTPTTPTASPSTSPTTTPVTTVRSSLGVGPARRTLKAGKKATWALRLKAAAGGERRTVTVVFDPARGRNVRIGVVTLRRTGNVRVQQGTLTYRPRKAGRIVVRYAGSRVSPTLRDTAASDSARVVIR